MLRRDEYGRYLTLFSLKWAGLNFAFGLFGPIGVSNAGHAGGFIGGVLAALAVIYRTNPQKLPDSRRLAGILFSLTLLCLAIGAGRATSAAWQAVSDPTGYAARENDDLLAKTEAMLAFRPGDVEALTQRSQAYAGKGDYDAALKDIDTAIDSGRDTPEMRRYKAWLYSQRGQALAQKGDYSAALADADTAIAGGIDMPGMHRIKAWLLVQLGRTAEALPETEIALRGDPTDVYALNIRAYLNEISGNSDQAIADYRAALRLDPKNESSQQGLQRLSGGK
jgi:tetratricopeptide (TPR) repeat protein